MSQASLLGLCSDNVVTILQPSSTIESIMDVASNGILGPFAISTNTATQANIVPLHPGNYILSINLSATQSISLLGRSMFLSIGNPTKTHNIPVFIPSSLVASANTTFASVSCNYIQTTDPLFITVTLQGPDGALSNISSSISCSVYYTKVN